jgi:5-methylcytosine-specific restriction protein A
LEEAKERSLAYVSQANLKKLAQKAKQKPVRRVTVLEQFVRNPYVASYVKKAAGGYCDLCQHAAPFIKDGEPFLHCHHVLWLARGGPDIIQNAVALCPNCHERMHKLDRKADIKRLVARMTARDRDLLPFDVFGGPSATEAKKLKARSEASTSA